MKNISAFTVRTDGGGDERRLCLRNILLQLRRPNRKFVCVHRPHSRFAACDITAEISSLHCCKFFVHQAFSQHRFIRLNCSFHVLYIKEVWLHLTIVKQLELIQISKDIVGPKKRIGINEIFTTHKWMLYTN